MKRVINNGRRRLGIPGRPAIILNPKESVSITDEQEKAITENRTAARWLDVGVIAIVDDSAPVESPQRVKSERLPVTSATRRPASGADVRQPETLPDGISGEGIERHHLGGGWYQVYVNGFKVTDRNVRKTEAEQIESEYEDGTDS